MQNNTTQQAPVAKKEEAKQPPRPVPPPEFQAEKLLKLDAPALENLLKDPKATVFEKAKACQRLANIGNKDSVPALASLLTNAQLSHYARYGLETNPDASADDALRAALAKVKGQTLLGVVNSISKRKDPKAVPALTKLIYGADIEVAKAAASAVGHISGLEALKSIQGALARTKGAVRDAVAAAGLVCAEGLLAKGLRAEGLSLYSTLSREGTPKPVRLGAMEAIIAAEVSLNRPR